MLPTPDKNRTIYPIIVAALLVLILISALLIKPIIILCVKEQIKKAMGADRVFIRDCHFQSFHSIFFYDVQIHRQNDFDIIVKEFSVGFNPRLMTVGVRLDKQKLFFKPLTGQMLNGLIDADINVRIEKEPEYSARFNFNNLDLAEFINAYHLGEKVNIQGLVAGHLVLKGRGKNLKILNGHFFSGRQGGNVIIKDTHFLKRFVTQSNQSADLLLESLKNYHYNTADIQLSLDQGTALLEINLNGETGKRNLQIRLHRFF